VFLGKDLKRTASAYNIPLNLPKNFLSISMKSAELITLALQQSHEGLDHEFALQVWDQFFGKGNGDLFQSGSLIELKPLLLQIGLSDEQANDVLAGAQTCADQLVALTDEAIEEGAFGAPTLILTKSDGCKEMFFGSDRFHHIALSLGEDPALPYQLLMKSKL